MPRLIKSILVPEVRLGFIIIHVLNFIKCVELHTKMRKTCSSDGTIQGSKKVPIVIKEIFLHAISTYIYIMLTCLVGRRPGMSSSMDKIICKAEHT